MSVPALTPLAAATLRVGRPERVLEIECGEGDATLFLAREFPAARVRGVDREEDAVRHAAARVGLDPEGRVAFKVGRPRRLPFPDGLFDLLVAIDAVPAAREAARVLRPGGRLLIVRTAGAGTAGLRDRLRARSLSARGLEPIERGEAGGGSFSISRLAGSEPSHPSV